MTIENFMVLMKYDHFFQFSSDFFFFHTNFALTQLQ